LLFLVSVVALAAAQALELVASAQVEVHGLGKLQLLPQSRLPSV
jgi:hypothetical protein